MDDGSMLKAATSFDVSTSLVGAKKLLADNGFTDHFGDPATMQRFDDFVAKQQASGNYGGKSLQLGGGGKAAILKHKLIISGKFGKDLNSIDANSWKKIQDESNQNYQSKFGNRRFFTKK